MEFNLMGSASCEEVKFCDYEWPCDASYGPNRYHSKTVTICIRPDGTTNTGTPFYQCQC